MSHPDSPNPVPSDHDATATPSFQPPAPPQQPYPGSAQNPHGQQPGPHMPYGQAPPSYGYHNAPYGQMPSPYGTIPPMGGPKRPGTATAAAVLGIISGSLGISLALRALNGILNDRSRSSDPIADATSWFLALAFIATAAGLLACGILLLKGRGYKLLLASVVAQAALTIFMVVAVLYGVQSFTGTNPSASTRSAATELMIVAAFYGAGGLGLSVSNLILLLRPATKQWVKQVS